MIAGDGEQKRCACQREHDRPRTASVPREQKHFAPSDMIRDMVIQSEIAASPRSVSVRSDPISARSTPLVRDTARDNRRGIRCEESHDPRGESNCHRIEVVGEGEFGGECHCPFATWRRHHAYSAVVTSNWWRRFSSSLGKRSEKPTAIASKPRESVGVNIGSNVRGVNDFRQAQERGVF